MNQILAPIVDRSVLHVREMYKKFDMPIGQEPRLLNRLRAYERLEFLLEELTELAEALGCALIEGPDGIEVAHDPGGRWPAGHLSLAADALVDLDVVLKGTAIEMGLPWEDLWDDVHRANMSKVRGVTSRGHQIDLVKPSGWVPPQTAEILARHRVAR